MLPISLSSVGVEEDLERNAGLAVVPMGEDGGLMCR